MAIVRVRVRVFLFIPNDYDSFLRGNYNVLSYLMLLKTVVTHSSSDLRRMFCSCSSNRFMGCYAGRVSFIKVSSLREVRRC